MMKPIISLLFAFLILSATINSYAICNQTSDKSFEKKVNSSISSHFFNANDWSDGTFKGVWSHVNSNITGEFIGEIQLGRSPKYGSFKGQFNYSEANTSSIISGIFLNNIIIGKYSESIENKQFYKFLGMILNRNNTNFDVTLILLNKQIIRVSGFFQYSFFPKLTGEYDIGIINQHLIDYNRPEFFTEDDTSDYRELMIRIWYPIEKKQYDDNYQDYMDYYTFQWLKDRSPIPLITIPNHAYTFVHPHIHSNISIINNNQIFPIIIFSPGYDGNFEIYTSLIEDLVSNGFIIISMNHPYVSGLTIFPDGRKISVESIKPYSFSTIVNDSLFILDYLEILNTSNTMFNGRLDLSRIGMYGHSFGGAATLECVNIDNRLKAGLTLDGAFSRNLIPNNFNKPFMIMLAENSFALNNSNILFNIMNNHAYKLIIKGSTHYAFTDVGILLNHFLPLIPPEILGFGSINTKRMVNITKSLELAFFQVYLSGYSEEILFDLLEKIIELDYEYKS